MQTTISATVQHRRSERAMMDAALMVIVVGVLAIALAADLGALLGFLKRRGGNNERWK
jgi:hypothetical protein